MQHFFVALVSINRPGKGAVYKILILTIMEEQNYRWRLVEKKLAGQASDEEIKQLDDVLNEEPYLTALMMDLAHLWGDQEEGAVMSKREKE